METNVTKYSLIHFCLKLHKKRVFCDNKSTLERVGSEQYGIAGNQLLGMIEKNRPYNLSRKNRYRNKLLYRHHLD